VGRGEQGDGRRRPRVRCCAGGRSTRRAAAQNRGAGRRVEEGGGELNQGLICEFRERHGPYCKGLATIKPVLK
jgi:hypothetical protein